jgi:hypothetical protein
VKAITPPPLPVRGGKGIGVVDSVGVAVAVGVVVAVGKSVTVSVGGTGVSVGVGGAGVAIGGSGVCVATTATWVVVAGTGVAVGSLFPQPAAVKTIMTTVTMRTMIPGLVCPMRQVDMGSFLLIT